MNAAEAKYDRLIELDMEPVYKDTVKVGVSRLTGEWIIEAPDGQVNTYNTLDDMINALENVWHVFTYIEGGDDYDTQLMTEEIAKKICKAETRWYLEDLELTDGEVLIGLESPSCEAALLIRKGGKLHLVEHVLDSMPFEHHEVELSDCLIWNFYHAIFPETKVPERCKNKCYWLGPSVGRYYVVRISPWLKEQFSKLL